MSIETPSLKFLLEELVGQRSPLAGPDVDPVFPQRGLGYSQFNELLLLYGFDRVSHAFFQFLVDGTLEYRTGAGFGDLQAFKNGIDRARQIALLFFGNVKFGFKKLSRDAEQLAFFFDSTQPLGVEELKKRHKPTYDIETIPSKQTYYLGYVVQAELESKLKKDPTNKDLLGEKELLDKVKATAIRNQTAYLISDHLDVYVATSMRRKHEYVEVADFVSQILSEDPIRELNLRFFDPTQAYCSDRIDKGLAEALMLKRAKCTVYLAQESDTLGKDSELASTLAQGKPVIAFVPSPTDQDIVDSVSMLSRLYSASKQSVILDRLQALSPNLAWTNDLVRRWISNTEEIEYETALQLLKETTHEHYKKRAATLRESHPLGVQVNLDTGVANGVLVVRTVRECAELVKRIVTRSLQFRIEKSKIGGVEYHFLRETVSDCIFRVMTGDAMLTNCFWNFYLDPSE